MNLKRTFTLFLMLCAITSFAQEPYNQHLGGVARITFPKKPNVIPEKNGTVYSLGHNRNVYLAQNLYAEKNMKDLLSNNINDSVYDATIRAVVSAVKGRLMYKKPVTVHSVKGKRFFFRAEIDGRDWYCYHDIFYLNRTIICYGIWSLDSLNDNSKPVKDFFQTFKLTIPESEIRQSNASELGFKAGYYIAKWFSIAVLLLLITGITLAVIFIRRAVDNKKRKNEYQDWNNYGQ